MSLVSGINIDVLFLCVSALPCLPRFGCFFIKDCYLEVYISSILLKLFTFSQILQGVPKLSCATVYHRDLP